MQVDVRYSASRAIAEIRALQQNVNASVVRALNRAGTTVRAEASREIRKEFNIKARVAKGQIILRRATRVNLTATIVASGHEIPLVEFDANWTKRMAGASVKIHPGDARKIVPHSWIMRSKGGKLGVFRRVGTKRKPVEYLLGVGIAPAFASKVVSIALKKIATDRFEVVMNQELRFQLSKQH